MKRVVRRILPVLIASLAALAESDAALLLHYTFDDGVNPTADSGTGSAAPGTLIGSGAAFSTDTPNGSGRSFSTNGNNSYVTTGTSANADTGTDPAKLDGLTSFTVTAWVKFNALPSENDRLVSDWTGSAGFDFRIGTPNVTNQTYPLYLTVDGIGAASVQMSGVGTWLFLAVTYNGLATTANAQFYTGTTSGPVTALGSAANINSGAVADNSVDLQVGGSAATTLDRSPNALFDDVRIYDEVLDASALEAIRVQGIPEASSVMLVAASAGGLLARRRRK